MVKPFRFWTRVALIRLNLGILLGAVVLCTLLQLYPLPGITLMGVQPNWLLIGVVTWSAKRTPLQGIVAGLALGWIQDGLTAAHPTHALGLALAGFLTSRVDKQRLIDEDFISAALLVFFLALVVEGILAGQFALRGDWNLEVLWLHLQRVGLSSAVLSSLCTPVLYVPLNRWWDELHDRLEPY
jgi:rod shape-determining protein MreD